MPSPPTLLPILPLLLTSVPIFPLMPMLDTKAATICRTPEPPGSLSHHLAQSSLEQATNCIRPQKERSTYCANPLTAWGCLVQEIGLFFLMWDFLSQLRVVHEGKEEAGRNSLKPSVLQWWIMFHKWGKCSLFHTGKNLSSDQHILTLVIFSVVSRDNSFVLISSSFPAFLLPHTALLSSQYVFIP